ncbi:hypothetical protein QF047_004136 [Arthrobacter sp. W4I7]|nr:hypothetical protein [Arthrobacter sp. W4I7]
MAARTCKITLLEDALDDLRCGQEGSDTRPGRARRPSLLTYEAVSQGFPVSAKGSLVSADALTHSMVRLTLEWVQLTETSFGQR